MIPLRYHATIVKVEESKMVNTKHISTSRKNQLIIPIVTIVLCIGSIFALVAALESEALLTESEFQLKISQLSEDGETYSVESSEFINGNISFGTCMEDGEISYSTNSVVNLINNRYLKIVRAPDMECRYTAEAYSPDLDIDFIASFENIKTVEVDTLDIVVEAYECQTDERGNIIPDSVDMSEDCSDHMTVGSTYLMKIKLFAVNQDGDAI